MSCRLPDELEQLIVDAGHASLKAWCVAAGIPYGTVATLRSRGRKIPDGHIAAMIATSRTPVTGARIRIALALPRRHRRPAPVQP